MKQKQHILPQVYLKQFGYQDKQGRWKVPTVSVKDIAQMRKLNKEIVKQSNIKSLLRKVNIYDIPGTEDNKQLEDFFQLAENEYPGIINEIHNRGGLSMKRRDPLIGFIAQLATRTKEYRRMIENILDNKIQSYLLAVLQGNQKLAELVHIIPRKSALNLITALSSGYIYFRLRNHFRISIIETTPCEKWATTDNPVVIKCEVKQNGLIDFMGIDTKLICPLSKDYLAYIDHPTSTFNFFEGFDQLAENKVNAISQKVFEQVWLDVTDEKRITEYLILPSKIPASTKANQEK